MKKNQLTISVIGLGRFGSLVTAIMSQVGEVMVYHHKVTPEISAKAKHLGGELVDLQTAAGADCIILCVPISVTEKMIKEITPMMKKGALLVDTCSVKTLPCDWLKQHTPKEIEIMGTHPMFGPVTSEFDFDQKIFCLNGLQIVLCPLRISKGKLIRIKKLLIKLGLDVIITTPADHDRQNAKTLSLVHFLGRGLSAAGVNEQSIYTPGYADLLKIYRHTTSDNWQLFYDMNNYNPYSEHVRQRMYEEFFGLEERIIKSAAIDDFAFHRQMIDLADKVMMKMLAERLKHVQAIGEIKKKNGMSTTDKNRENEIVANRSKESGLDEKFLSELYKVIFKEAKRRQK